MKQSISLEKSYAFRYAMIASQVAQVVKKYASANNLNDIDKKIISGGKEMLENIIKGSTLVEKKGTVHGISPSQEGLFIFGGALNAVDNLHDLAQQKGFTEIFLWLLERMDLICKQQPISNKELDIIKKFFIIVSDNFRDDFKKGKYLRKEPISFSVQHSF